MPGAIYSASIAGDGAASMGGSAVWYAVCHMTAVAAGARELEVGSSDHLLRAGWVAFGDTLSVIGATARDYWRAVWWLDFVDSLYTPVPSTGEAGGPLGLVASRIRWHIPVGGAADIYVFGV